MSSKLAGFTKGSSKPLSGLASKPYSKHYYALLVNVMVLAFVAPLIDHSVLSHIAIAVILLGALVVSTLSVRREEKFDWKSIALAVTAAAAWALAFCSNLAPFNTANFQMLALITILVFFIYIVRIMVMDILTGEVNSNRICGGACVYILIGFCFALIHMMIAINNPYAYKDNIKADETSIEHQERYPLLIYFSFCTLSTVGYGDVVPLSRSARACSCLEALCGQLYLAILVARLVGMHTAVKAEPKRLEAERQIESAQ